MSIKKWLVNDEARVVQDSLHGLGLLHGRFVALVVEKEEDDDDDDDDAIPLVALRVDVLEASPPGTVRLVCGGGSGHEPAHAGFVCPEMRECCFGDENCGRGRERGARRSKQDLHDHPSLNCAAPTPLNSTPIQSFRRSLWSYLCLPEHRAWVSSNAAE